MGEQSCVKVFGLKNRFDVDSARPAVLRRQYLQTNLSSTTSNCSQEKSTSATIHEFNFSHYSDPIHANVLLNGSGVVCEFCNAEVHPDAVICPSCSADIAEWIA